MPQALSAASKTMRAMGMPIVCCLLLGIQLGLLERMVLAYQLDDSNVYGFHNPETPAKGAHTPATVPNCIQGVLVNSDDGNVVVDPQGRSTRCNGGGQPAFQFSDEYLPHQGNYPSSKRPPALSTWPAQDPDQLLKVVSLVPTPPTEAPTYASPEQPAQPEHPAQNEQPAQPPPPVQPTQPADPYGTPPPPADQSASQGHAQLYGLGYSVFRVFGACPTDAEVESDLDVLLRYSRRVRLYSTECGNVMEIVLRRASSGELGVLLGVWIDNRETDQKEVDDLVLYLDRYPQADVTGIVVGNEPLFRNTLTPSQVAGRVVEVREKVQQVAAAHNAAALGAAPIFSVDVFPHPEVTAVSDVMGANVHPFYRTDISDHPDAEAFADDLVAKSYEQYQTLGATHGKKVVITEIGWPTSSAPSDSNTGRPDVASAFLRKWAAFAAERGVEYYWFELFDSSWKKATLPHEPSSMSEFNWGLIRDDHVTDKGLM